MEFSKHDLQTVQRALQMAHSKTVSTLRAAQARGKSRPGHCAGLAMEAADYSQLFKAIEKELEKA